MWLEVASRSAASVVALAQACPARTLLRVASLMPYMVAKWRIGLRLPRALLR